MFRCPRCGAYVKGKREGNNIESGVCKKCKTESKVKFWHYIDESGEAVCGVDVLKGE